MKLENQYLNTQIEEYINDLIKSGQLRAGDRLPSLRSIASHFNTSITPVRQATQLFIKKGVLENIHGSGVFLKQETLNRTRTNRIGLLFSHAKNSLLESPYFREIVTGVDKGTFEIRNSLVWQALVPDTGENFAENIYKTMEIVDGLILVAPLRRVYEEIEETLLGINKPVVVLEWEGASESINAVLFDSAANTETGMNFLLSLGHQRIGYIGWGSWVDPEKNTAERKSFNAYRNILFENRLPIKDEYIIQNLFYDDPEPLREMLKRPDLPTALFCFTSSSALMIADVARELGIGIPDDLSVIGIGDTDQNVRDRGITTITRDPQKMGREGVRRLNEMVEEYESGTREVKRIILPGHINKRNSHAVPRK